MKKILLAIWAGLLPASGFVGLAQAAAASQSALHAAAENGLTDWVRQLLERGVAYDGRNAAGFSPMQVAAAAGQIEVMRLLLARYPQVLEAAARDGQTPLALAIAAEQFSAARWLLAAGANPLHADSLGMPPLLLAWLHADADLLADLRQRGYGPERAGRLQLADGRTGLHVLATRPRQDPMIQQLLTAGAPAHARAANGQTALEMALAANRWENALPLVAGLTEEPEQGRRAWRLLAAKLDGENLTQTAGGSELLSLLKAFQAQGDWISAPDDGASLLSRRLSERDLTALQILLPLTRVDRPGPAQPAPLLTAIQLQPPFPAGVQLLLDAGARVLVQDAQGNTPLHAAVLVGSPELVSLLLPRYGSLPRNAQGQTPLDLARKSHQARLIRLLRRLYIHAQFD